MLARLKQNVAEEVLRSKVQYLVICFCLFAGIAAGMFAAGGAKQGLSETTAALLAAIKTSAVDHLAVLFYAWLQNTAVFAAISFFSLIMAGPLFVAAIVLLKGLCVGFAVGALSLMFGAGGFFAIVFASLLPNLILLPCICRAGVMGWNHSLMLIRSRRTPRTARDRMVLARPFFRRMIKVYAAALAGVLVQALASPAMLRWI